MKNSFSRQQFYFALSMFLCFLTVGCQKIEVSDVQYTMVVNNSWLITNDYGENLNRIVPSEFTIDADGDTIFRKLYPTDYYTENNNTFETGYYYLMKRSNTPGYENTYVKIDGTGRPYINANGFIKYYETEPAMEHKPRIIPAKEGIYIFYDETYETGERDRLGRHLLGYIYKVSLNGGTPYKIAEQRHTEIGGPISEIRNIKKYGETFYMTGYKDRSAYFCDAGNLATPLLLSLDLAEANDFTKIDTTSFIVCGENLDRACQWRVDGVAVKQDYLEGTENADYSVASSVCFTGEDVYIGGRIGDVPVIWKNQKLLAAFTNRPNYLKNSDIVAIEVFNDKAYTILESKATQEINALEWTLFQQPANIICKYGLSSAFYMYNTDNASDLNFSHSKPRISLDFVKTRH